MKTKGTVHKYGNHIDTDVIIPARLLNNPDPQVLGKNCMVDIDPEFATRVKENDIIVGGINFGCGSSREHAPIAIKAAGVSCVIAESFARIFYRNSINIGLPLLESPDAVKNCKAGDQLEVDFSTGEITNITTGETYSSTPLPEFIQKIVSAGGLIDYAKAKEA